MKIKMFSGAVAAATAVVTALTMTPANAISRVDLANSDDKYSISYRYYVSSFKTSTDRMYPGENSGTREVYRAWIPSCERWYYRYWNASTGSSGQTDVRTGPGEMYLEGYDVEILNINPNAC